MLDGVARDTCQTRIDDKSWKPRMKAAFHSCPPDRGARPHNLSGKQPPRPGTDQQLEAENVAALSGQPSVT